MLVCRVLVHSSALCACSSCRPEIANFTLGEANLLRKAVAKKDAKKIEKMKKRFFEAVDKEENK